MAVVGGEEDADDGAYEYADEREMARDAQRCFCLAQEDVELAQAARAHDVAGHSWLAVRDARWRL